MENDIQFNEKELLEKVEKAAMEGARKGSGSGAAKELIKALVLKVAIPALIIIAVLMFIIPKVSLTGSIKGIFEVDKPVEDRDLTIENHGFLGYTAADFAEAVLKDRTQLRKLSVTSYKVSDAATITVEGLAKLKMFSKNQIITYHGTAVYTIDLSALTDDCIILDENNKTVTLMIPHAQLEPINIQAEDMEFGDVEKGLLAFGSIKLEPGDMAKIQSEAQAKMEQKLLYDNISAEADRFAKMAVWELYQPIISSVSSEYRLNVIFR